jgi:hypothetical protein
MIEFMLALPLSVYDFNQHIIERQLLYSGPSGLPSYDEGEKYNVVCASGYTSRGIPSYLVSFCCPPSDSCGPEIFTVQIRKDYWGRLPPVDWFSLVVDGAQRKPSFEYP